MTMDEDRIVLREVGLRDGLQMTATWPSTDAKLEWMRTEHRAGIMHFEVGSFLPHTRYPQFADIEALLSLGKALDRACTSALALNERGVANALASPVNEMVMVVSATESHSQANARRSRDQAMDLIRHACRERVARQSDVVVVAAIAMAFGCTMEGTVPVSSVLSLVETCLMAGADMISIADTVGVAAPRHVKNLCDAAGTLLDPSRIILHLHDTRGLGMANAIAAIEAGVRMFDGSLGGLGGCPFAPGATGNIVLEDLAMLCEMQGLRTGIDLNGLLEARELLRLAMPGETLHGALARAGLPISAHGNLKHVSRN